MHSSIIELSIHHQYLDIARRVWISGWIRLPRAVTGEGSLANVLQLLHLAGLGAGYDVAKQHHVCLIKCYLGEGSIVSFEKLGVDQGAHRILPNWKCTDNHQFSYFSFFCTQIALSYTVEALICPVF